MEQQRDLDSLGRKAEAWCDKWTQATARVRELEKEGLRKEGAGAKKRSHEECEKPTWQQSLLGWTGMFR